MGVLLYVILALVIARLVLVSWQGGAERQQVLATRDAEIRRLREEMDVLQAEVRRLADEQSFMVRLLSPGERPPGGLPSPEPPRDPNPEKP